MLDALERRARELSFRTLHLDTTVSQIPAQQLYLKNGFQEVGRVRLGGLDCILYEKDISEDSSKVWMSNDD
jgi:RimJ/RimL family protein N-acetyltransferase